MDMIVVGHQKCVICSANVKDTAQGEEPTMSTSHKIPLITITIILPLLSELQLFLGVPLWLPLCESDFDCFWPLADSKPAAMTKLEHAVAKRMCGVGIIICGLLLMAVALIMGLEFPKFVYQKNLKDSCILDTSHRLYEKWVKDHFRDKFNRLYYWEITNKDDFLYSGAAPQVKERGPYVYREYEEKHDVRFSYSSVDFYLRRWQVFSPELTKAECGTNCTEKDQVTILNPHYFSQVGKYGGDTNYALLAVPDTVDTTITDVSLLTNTNFTGAMALFGKATDTVLNSLTQDLGYPATFSHLGFGSWLGLQDTVYKTVVHNHRGQQDFTAKEMAGLFAVIKNAALLGATQDLLSRTSYVTECDVNANVPRFFPNQELGAGVLQYDTKPPACSFLACLSKYIELQLQTVQDVRHVTNVTECLARYLCMNNGTACFTLPANPYFQQAYIFAIHEYITVHWTRYAFYNKVHSQNQDLVVTRPQAEFALGYYLVNLTDFDGDAREHFVPGLLEHTNLAADVRWKSKKISLYNCYDATEASTNFFWKGYDGQVSVPEQQFPNASSLERRIYSYRRNMPPIQELNACQDTLLKEESYFFFLPMFWRKFQFRPTGVKYIGDKIVNVVSVNRSMFEADDIYNSEDGLQAMRATYGYLSWLSLPHFLYADNTGLVDEFNTSPEEDKHNLQVSIEPVTGVVWESCIRYQLNTGLTPLYTSVGRPQPLQVFSSGRPLPVYWVDSYFLYNNAGQAEYEDRVGRLMRAACGGMIGMGVIAVLFIIVGIMLATIRMRSGRVAPAEVTEGL